MLDRDGYDTEYKILRTSRNRVNNLTWPNVTRKSRYYCRICYNSGMGKLLPTAEPDKFYCRSCGKTYTVKLQSRNNNTNNNQTLHTRNRIIHSDSTEEQLTSEDVNDLRRMRII
jgi:hypothetical protein